MVFFARNPAQRLFQLGSLVLVLSMVLPSVFLAWAGRGFVRLEGAPRLEEKILATAVQAFIGLAFLTLTLWLTRRETADGGRKAALSLIGQLLLALPVNWHLVVLVVAELPLLFPSSLARKLFWVSLGLSGLFVAGAARPEGVAAITSSGLHFPLGLIVLAVQLVAWQTFAYAIGFLTAKARQDACRHRRLNQELRLLHRSLDLQSRAAERLSLLGELHDGVGHLVSALALHLQLAQRESGKPRDEAIQTARSLTSQLLEEVRGLVKEGRVEALNLPAALFELATLIPEPHIEVEWDPGLKPWRARKAIEVFRCIQEAVSNAIRHSGASNLRIEARRLGEMGQVCVSDDGSGGQLRSEGSGLAGMRERLLALQGDLEISRPEQGGWNVILTLPLEEG